MSAISAHSFRESCGHAPTLFSLALGAGLVTGVKLGGRIDLTGRGAQEHIAEEGEHDTHGNADIGHIEDREVDEGGCNKIGHEAKGQTIDSVADSTARNHRHAYNLKMGELGRTNDVHGNSDNDRQRQHGKRDAMPSPMLKAAPILRTNIKSMTPGMTVTCKASPTARTASLVSWSTSSTTSATPPATPNRQRKGGVISPVRPKEIPYPQEHRIPFNASNHLIVTNAKRAAYSPTLAK